MNFCRLEKTLLVTLRACTGITPKGRGLYLIEIMDGKFQIVRLKR